MAAPPARARAWKLVAMGTGGSNVTLRPTPPDLWESNFGTEPAFRLGVEEELLLVGRDNELVDRSAQVVRDTHPDEGGVDSELFKAMVESRSEISVNAREA